MRNMEKRDYSIDVARGIACLMVVVGHVPSTLSFLHTWIYSFHMPLFFIISGIVLNTSDSFKVFLKKRCKSLLVPYFILNFSVWLIETIIKVAGGIILFHKIEIKRIFDTFLGTIIGYRLTNYYYILWFLIALFLGLLCAYSIIRLVKSNLWSAVCGITLIFLNALLWEAVKGMPLSLDVVPLSTGFILIGYAARSLISHYIWGKMRICGIPLLIINVCIAVIGSHYYGDVDLYKCQMGGVLLFIINSLIGSFAILLISKIIIRNRMLEFFSANSMTFYAFQNKLVIPVFDKVVNAVDAIILNNSLIKFEWIFVCVGSIVTLSVISIIINRIAPWMVGKRTSVKE